jgi:hypothetical protein
MHTESDLNVFLSVAAGHSFDQLTLAHVDIERYVR